MCPRAPPGWVDAVLCVTRTRVGTPSSRVPSSLSSQGTAGPGAQAVGWAVAGGPHSALPLPSPLAGLWPAHIRFLRGMKASQMPSDFLEPWLLPPSVQTVKSPGFSLSPHSRPACFTWSHYGCSAELISSTWKVRQPRSQSDPWSPGRWLGPGGVMCSWGLLLSELSILLRGSLRPWTSGQPSWGGHAATRKGVLSTEGPVVLFSIQWSHSGSGALVPTAGLEKVEEGRAAFLVTLPPCSLGPNLGLKSGFLSWSDKLLGYLCPSESCLPDRPQPGSQAPSAGPMPGEASVFPATSHPGPLFLRPSSHVWQTFAFFPQTPSYQGRPVPSCACLGRGVVLRAAPRPQSLRTRPHQLPPALNALSESRAGPPSAVFFLPEQDCGQGPPNRHGAEFRLQLRPGPARAHVEGVGS